MEILHFMQYYCALELRLHHGNLIIWWVQKDFIQGLLAPKKKKIRFVTRNLANCSTVSIKEFLFVLL